MLFGVKSEKLVRRVAQLELQLEELETSRGRRSIPHLPSAMETEQELRQSSCRTLPDHLPREVDIHRPETSCCPGGARIVEAALWAKTRRKFHDIFAATALATASNAIRSIGLIYAVEKQVRAARRRFDTQSDEHVPGPMQALRVWLDQLLQTLSAKGDIAERSVMRSRAGPHSHATSTTAR